MYNSGYSLTMESGALTNPGGDHRNSMPIFRGDQRILVVSNGGITKTNFRGDL